MIQSRLFRMRTAVLFLAWLAALTSGQFGQSFGQQQSFQQSNVFNPQLQQQSFNTFSTTGHNAQTEFDGNLVWYGPSAGDKQITDNQRQNGMQIKLHNFFPYYGGRYNYTMISTNGFISFAYFSDDQSTLQIGTDADWPTQSDPALIAPYMCKQRIQSGQGTDSQIYYRLEVRKNVAQQIHNSDGFNQQRRGCLGKPEYFRCDEQSDTFLNSLQAALMQGVAGASTFRAEAALVVTWKNMRPNIGSESGLSTYQLVWMSDAQGLQSYTMINYQKLGFDAADLQGNIRTGKCQAVFNGGNHTGSVQVDLNEMTKHQPSSLADRSSVPHIARGRYFHRVDDIVRPAGCSNKTGGTFPLLIYPNIVSMLGQVKVDINGLCLNPSVTYVLMIEQRQTAPCEILNPSIARCTLPRIQDWGTKTVYFQPQSGLSNDEKAYVGFVYFVPPTIDPMRLDIGDIHSWYLNPPPSAMTIKWYPRNFTQDLHRGLTTGEQFTPINYMDDSIYNVQLGLYIVGYNEAQDTKARKWTPQHRVLARWMSFANRAEEHFKWNPMVERLNLDHPVDQWYLTEKEQREELFEFRFGYLKLAPIPPSDPVVTGKEKTIHMEIPDGLISSPISLHWLWSLTKAETGGHQTRDKEEKLQFVKEKSKEMCHAWYNEDGALNNFIRETESNASCPCMEKQAKMDLGRFMPHPRCSNLFRDVSCTETLGAMNCYMSAQNVHGSTHKKNKHGESEFTTYATHYGQTCCYDQKGYLMQSSYQPVVKVDESTPYSPGFPTRAYEMGSDPYQGMFEVPGLSTFHHDIMPYYLCCKYADFRCQMFYWRRPSSACQAYEPPATGSIMGAGVISTLNNRNLIFNDPGIYTLLHSHKSATTPEVQIQVRMERFPDRSVDFGHRNIEQRDLVQPTNSTVVTGVVLQTEDADRVHVLLRKDTRRGRYKTSIIVGNVIRYFDNMHLQRFRGVTVYVNNVEKGQAEIYVVLDQAQIGMRIRESYAIDIDRKFQYEESLGLMDIQISVPPQYKVNGGVSRVRELSDPHVEGLINPFPDEVIMDQRSTVTWSSVNDGGARAQLMKYKIKGDEDIQNTNLHADDVKDLFQARNEQEKTFQAFADHFLKGPVYKVSSYHQRTPFIPVNEADFRRFLDFCKTNNLAPEYMSREEKKLYGRCPKDVGSLEQDCGNDVTCLFDAVMLQARLLGDESRESFNTYIDQRIQGVARYNSCGAMNIEYPEYLIKGPSSGQQAYLEGAVISFSCFQTHVMMGDTTEFTCQKYRNEHDTTSYRYQWTQGDQPWCRHRAKDNILTWLMWTAIVLGVLLVPICVFFACWTVKQSRKNRLSREKEERGIEMEPLKLKPPKPASETGSASSDMTKFDKEPGSRSRQQFPPLSQPPSRGPSPYNSQQPISFRRNVPGELSV